jgi:hypothetical protein
VTGASVGKFSLFDNQQFTAFVDRLNCPVIIARDFTILGVSKECYYAHCQKIAAYFVLNDISRPGYQVKKSNWSQSHIKI